MYIRMDGEIEREVCILGRMEALMAQMCVSWSLNSFGSSEYSVNVSLNRSQCNEWSNLF